ncbi:MAG: tRNA (N6-threonylcarbamoyladenosine(37)-N6)-methyltransferase TrmO [Bacteroidales bacterium]|nr:tRNA (N6-threonylcarbamoyladenosine(37)-N6)-methyltransferase TrmO [Candidatus Colimorpha onthohippi]
MTPIAHISSCYTSKFGVPRQAGIIDSPASIVFEPDYRVAEAVRGLEGFDYIWLIWQFNQTMRNGWSPTVRPPRLGGNSRIGVFATRSPFRPNHLGLSSVRLISIDYHSFQGPVLHIAGADLMDGTPIFDIKPYLPYADSHPDARSGFANQPTTHLLQVECPQELISSLPQSLRQTLIDTIALDPRPQYHHDPNRIYGMPFGGYEVKFKVAEGTATIVEIVDSHSSKH